MTHVKTNIPSRHADIAAQGGLPGWWLLDCLRSLGRAASLASGQAGRSSQQHADYRGFRILTTGQEGSYCAYVTHWQDKPIHTDPQHKHDNDNARFGSHEEAAQHARFMIASGTLNHLGPRA
jgi:hypothetical protein